MAIKGPVRLPNKTFNLRGQFLFAWVRTKKAKRDSDPNSSGSSNDAITSTEAGFRFPFQLIKVGWKFRNSPLQ